MEEANIIVLAVLLISVTNVFSQAISRDLPAEMDPSISRIIRKVLRSNEEILDENVRRFQRGHFFSKNIMPSLIPGQKEKCWDRCVPGQKSAKEELGLEEITEITETTTAPTPITTTATPPPKKQTKRKLIRKKTRPHGDVHMTVTFSRTSEPMMLTALLAPMRRRKH